MPAPLHDWCNIEATRFSGINVRMRTLGAFTLMGLLVSRAALVSTVRLNSATTSAEQNAEIEAIASDVIGGTSLIGGEGTLFKDFLSPTELYEYFRLAAFYHC